MKNFFVFVLAIALFIEFNEACKKNTLSFKNELVTTRGDLIVHCRSRDDDLGEHYVAFNGPTYNIRFGDNLFITTKWYCVLQQAAALKFYQKFDAYSGGFIKRCGGLDIWIAREDGLYLTKDGKSEEKKFDWLTQG